MPEYIRRHATAIGRGGRCGRGAIGGDSVARFRIFTACREGGERGREHQYSHDQQQYNNRHNPTNHMLKHWFFPFLISSEWSEKLSVNPPAATVGNFHITAFWRYCLYLLPYPKQLTSSPFNNECVRDTPTPWISLFSLFHRTRYNQLPARL
jgi:hypothetical protein